MSTHVLSDAEVNALRNLVPIGPGTANLATVVQAGVALTQPMPFEAWTQERLDLLKKTYCQGATDAEFELFVGNCKRLRLSPEARQIWSVPRRQKDPNTDEYVTVRQTMVSIDGLRLIAERTGRYEGQTRTEWCGKDGVWKEVWLEAGPPAAARVGVFKTGFREPLYRVARYAAFCDERSPMWRKMGDHMCAKVAEALAIRAAFPQETSGAYTDDEMGQAGDSAPEARAEVVESKPVPTLKDALNDRKAEIDARKAASERPDTRPAHKIGVNDGTQAPDPETGMRLPRLIGKAYKDKVVTIDTLKTKDEVVNYIRSMMHAKEADAEKDGKWQAYWEDRLSEAKLWAARARQIYEQDYSRSKAERAAQLAAAVKGDEHEYSDEMYLCENHGMYGEGTGLDVDIRTWNSVDKLEEYMVWLRKTYNQPTQTGRIACVERCWKKLIEAEQERAEQATAGK